MKYLAITLLVFALLGYKIYRDVELSLEVAPENELISKVGFQLWEDYFNDKISREEALAIYHKHKHAHPLFDLVAFDAYKSNGDLEGLKSAYYEAAKNYQGRYLNLVNESIYYIHRPEDEVLSPSLSFLSDDQLDELNRCLRKAEDRNNKSTISPFLLYIGELYFGLGICKIT